MLVISIDQLFLGQVSMFVNICLFIFLLITCLSFCGQAGSYNEWQTNVGRRAVSSGSRPSRASLDP